LYDKKCPPSDACTNKGGTCVKDCAFGAACDPDICEEEGCLCQIFPVSCPFDDLCSLKNGECIEPCVAGVGQNCDKELCNGLDNNCACLYKKCPASDECTNKGGECVKDCVKGGLCLKDCCEGDDCFCDLPPVVPCKVALGDPCFEKKNGRCIESCIAGVGQACDNKLCNGLNNTCGCLYDLADGYVEPFCIEFNTGDPDPLGGFAPCPGALDNVAVVHSPFQSVDPLTNTITGDQYMHLRDQSGASVACGQGTDNVGDWSGLANSNCKCWNLCFDARIFNDGVFTNEQYFPYLLIRGGAPDYYGAVLRGYDYITDSSGDQDIWQTVCGPLAPLNDDGSLPSNAGGYWTMGSRRNSLGGSATSLGVPSNSAWTDLLSDVTNFEVSFDVNSGQNERFAYDNICIKEGDCPVIPAPSTSLSTSPTASPSASPTETCPPSDECTNKGGECVKKCVQGGECIKEYCKGDDCFCDFKPVVLCKVQVGNSCQVERNGSCQKPCIPGVDEECDTNLCQSAKYCGCLYKKCPPSEKCTNNGGTCVTECKGANCVKEWCDGVDCSCQVFPVSCSVQPGDVACSKKKGTCVKPCIASKGQGCDQKLCEGKGCGCLYSTFSDEIGSPNFPN